jgi:photosystem II stability/assembly factor-like uncharacterized protein
VYADIAEVTSAGTYGRARLYAAAVGTDDWQPVSGVAASPGSPGEISLAEGSVWAMLHPVTDLGLSGTEVHSALYRTNDGFSWRSEALPCPGQTIAAVAAASRARVVIICTDGGAAGSQGKSAYESVDSGSTYTRVSDPPEGGGLEGVAASPAAVIVAAASGATDIYGSFDNGETWKTALLIGDGGLGLSDLGFTTPTQGVVIHGQLQYPQSLELLMTRDGGHTWAPAQLFPT